MYFPLTLFLVLYYSCFLIILDASSYNIPSYYGHFSKNYFKPSKIAEGTFTYFQYHFGVDFDYTNKTVFFVNTDKNCIQAFDLNSGRKSILAGRCNKQGNRVGDTHVMLFRKPKCVAFYQYSEESAIKQLNMKMNIVKNSTCNIKDQGCIINPPNNQTLTMNNLRPYPPIKLFPNLSSTKYLYVSDTQNHCIKRINLDIQTSQIVAGSCGQSGFSDGPLGMNKLNRPTGIGVNKLGTVFFYDEGNERMRKILKNGEVQTLLNGACKQYKPTRIINGYNLKSILCYDNWIETYINSQ